MKENRHAHLDRLLDLLTEEVAERLRDKFWLYSAPPDRDAVTAEAVGPPEAEEPPPAPPEPAASSMEPGVVAPQPVPEPEPDTEVEAEPEPEEAETEAPILAPPPSHTARFLGRMALGLLIALILINIPINRHGTTLATAMPDSRALVIRDGLVVKEEDAPEIYVYQDGQFRWISSLKAFEMRGHTWEDVHVVEDGFLESFVIGPPIHVILKCRASPHIYRLEGEEKRWIVDIQAFEAEGYVWDDVQFVSCSYLRNLPDGETIPPGHGPPPQP